MDQIIDKMVVENVLEYAPETPSFLSTIFLTPKGDGSMHKSVLAPQKFLEYLGLVWNTGQNKKFLPEKKIQGLQEVISRLVKRKQASLREVQSIIGSLNFARFVPQGRLKFRCMLAHCNSLLQNHPETPYPLPFQPIEELKWWMLNCQKSSRLHPPPKTHFLTTDAADSGWGAELNGIKMGGDWLDGEGSFHSNHKEMLT
ncbi:putative transposon Ty3-I Gag-Pol polyprotein, partial [Operophtera brumata]